MDEFTPSGVAQPNEMSRLRALLRFECPDDVPAPALDAVCRFARNIFGVPIAFVTLVGSDTLAFVAAQGLETATVPHLDAICCHTIMSDEILIVPDAAADPRFSALPSVTGAPHLRFYVGAPLIAGDGLRVGTLCLADTVSRAFPPQDVEQLRSLAGLVTFGLQQRRVIYELEREKDLFAKTSRIAKVASWSFDIRTQSLVWSDEASRILDLGTDIVPTREIVAGLLSRPSRQTVEKGMDRLIRDGATFNEVLSATTANGRSLWLRCLAEAERTSGIVTRISGIVQDVTVERIHAAEIERLAYRDILTGLPNRALFQTRLAEALTNAARSRSRVGLVMLDIDHFKDVNDTLGHDAGDALLATVASQLQTNCRLGDTVARLSGDEFAIVLTDVGSAANLAETAARFGDVLREPLDIDGKSLSVTASLGMSVFPDDARDPVGLLKNADIALYRAKNGGRNRAVLFDRRMLEEVEARFALLRDIRRGIAAGEFGLLYQPLISLGEPLEVTGLEAVMRWAHPDRGSLVRSDFMVAFEDPVLALALGDVALEEAVAQMRRWGDDGVAFGRVTVSLAAAPLRRGGLAASILDKLRRHGVSPARLTLEVTENICLGSDADAVRAELRELHEAGILIALDDFGLGRASLSNLCTMPIDRLKMDRAFVANLAQPAIVATILGLGRAMGVQIVAEGVEDARQLKLLAAMGCNQVQGLYFGAPMVAAEVAAYVADFATLAATKLQDVA